MDRLVIRENMYIMRAGHIMYNLTLTFHGFVSSECSYGEVFCGFQRIMRRSVVWLTRELIQRLSDCMKTTQSRAENCCGFCKGWS